MATESDNTQPTSTGPTSQQQSAVSKTPAANGDVPKHGTTGEGAGSAMARLISQEQARIVPGTPEDEPNESS